MMPLRAWEMGQKELKDNIQGHVLMEEELDRLFMKVETNCIDHFSYYFNGALFGF